MIVGHLVLAAHDVAQRRDGVLLVRLLQLVDVGRSVGIVPVLHHGLDEHRHDDVLRFVVLYERDGRVGLAAIVSVEGVVETVEEGLGRNIHLVGEGTVAERHRILVEVAGFQHQVAAVGSLEDALVGQLNKQIFGFLLFLFASGQILLGLGKRGLAGSSPPVIFLDAAKVTERVIEMLPLAL